MKIAFLQFTDSILRVTAAKPGRRAVFYEPQAFAFPPELAGRALEDPGAFARFAADCLKASGHKPKEVVLCMDDSHIISREYRHAPSKPKFYPSFARLEAEDLVSDDIKNYTVQSIEYGREVGGSGELAASLFAMHTKLAASLRKAFAKVKLRLTQISPTITGALYSASRMLSEGSGTVAVVNLDYGATRLLVYTRGKPVFQRGFAGVVDDIAALVAGANQVSLIEALSLLREHGMRTTASSPEGLEVQEQVQILLNAATGEVLRTLRMVLSSERLDLDRIILCGPVSSLPGFGAYCEEMGLEVPVEMIETTPISTQVLPALDPEAQRKGFKPGRYFSLNGLLSARREGGVNFLKAANQKSGNRTASIAAMAVLTLLTVAVFSIQPILYQSLLARQAEDKAALVDPKYNELKSLITQQGKRTQQINALESDKKLLPFGQSRMGEVVEQVQARIASQVLSLDSCAVNNQEGLVSLSFTTSSFADYITLKNKVTEDGYFSVAIPFSATVNASTGECVCSVTLAVTSFVPFQPGAVPPDSEEGGEAE